MRYLLSDAFARRPAMLKRFTIITEATEALWPGCRRQAAFAESGFYRDVAEFGYALLSHFA